MKLDFAKIANFPGVVGCIDGTHIKILAPSKDEAQYVNIKGFHSLNVQAICDPNGKFLNVVAKCPGSSHDSFILRSSAVFETFEMGDTDGIILGDSAYPLSFCCGGKYILRTVFWLPSSGDPGSASIG